MARAPSLTTIKVLDAMLQDPTGNHYGLGLIDVTGLKSGSLYPILRRLEEQRWIAGEWEDIDEAAEGRRRRRYYKLTPDGLAVAIDLVTSTHKQLALPARTRRLGSALA
jgi:DNA-binding PadR family transcriptional regulator